MKHFIKAFFITFGLSITFAEVVKGPEISTLFTSVQNSPYLLLFSVIGLTYLLKKVDMFGQKTSILQKAISIFFAINTWLMDIYSSNIKSINQVLVDKPIGIVFSIIKLVSYYFILEAIQKIILNLYYRKDWSYFNQAKIINNKFFNIFSKHVFIVSFLFLFILWSLIALSAYPATFMGDTMNQVMQYLGIYDRSAAHPVLSTIVIGWFIDLGIKLGSANIGAFLLTIFQMFVVALCFSYSIKIFTDLKGNKVYGLVIIILIGVSPVVHGTLLLITKDIIFSGLFVLYMSTLITYFYNKDYFFIKKMYVIHFFSIVFMILFRYNTIHFLALTLIIYIVYAIFIEKKFMFFKSIITIGILSIFIGSIFNSILVNNFAEFQPKPNRREMLSLPFQQTARYIQYHEDELTDNDKKIISNVLNYDVIKNDYDPYRSDNVKATHNEEATSEQMKEYFGLVIKQTIKHPLVTFESIAASHSNLFSINTSNNTYYSKGVFVHNPVPKHYLTFGEEYGLKNNNVNQKLSKLRTTLYRLWDRLPFFSQLNNYGSYVFLLFVMCAIFIRDRKIRYSGLTVPMLAILGTLIAGPITIGYIRYFLPVILVVPVLFGFFLSTNKRDIVLRRNNDESFNDNTCL